MTSAAATQAGRMAKRTGARKAGGGRTAAASTPRIPRRVSGPSRGAAGTPRVSRTQAGSVALPRPGIRISRPPLRRPTIPRPALPRRRRAAPAAPPLTRAARFLVTLPDHRWLDRLVRGRAWIPLLGVLLTGIVFMQVEVLKLGASIGRSVSLATELQSRNQLLRAGVARLSDDGRIERLAVHLGMTMPGPTEHHFVSAGGPGILNRALSQIAPPDTPTFLAGLQAENAAAVANDPIATAASNAASTTSATSATAGASPALAGASPALGPASSTVAAGGASSATVVTTPAATSTPPPTDPAAGSASSPASGGVALGGTSTTGN